MTYLGQKLSTTWKVIGPDLCHIRLVVLSPKSGDISAGFVFRYSTMYRVFDIKFIWLFIIGKYAKVKRQFDLFLGGSVPPL